MALLLLLVLLVASMFTGGTAPVGAVGQASGLYFGAYGGSETLSSAQVIRSVGVQGVRMYIEWAELEPSAGYEPLPLQSSAKLSEYDDRLRNLAQVGLKPILMVGRAPNWAAARERGPLFPDKYNAFAGFMRKLVQRWSGAPYNVKHWELWPEPDFGDKVDQLREPQRSAYLPRRAWGDNGAEYAAMLKVAYPAIKGADPAATVLMGSIAFDLFRDNGVGGDQRSSPGYNQGGPFVYHFLDDVLAAGGGCCFDWLPFNSYSVFATGWEANNPGTGKDLVAKASHIRRVKLAPYNVDKPLLTLEAGIWSCCTNFGHNFYLPPGWVPGQDVADYIPDERVQAAYQAQLYARGLAADLKGVYWYLVYDQQPATVLTDPDQHRGWWHKDGSAKPASRTIELMTGRLSGATFGGGYGGAFAEIGAVEAYKFTRADGREVVMLWSPFGPNETARVKLQDGLGKIVYNALGETVVTERAEGANIRLTVGYTPIFVESFGNLGHRSVIPHVPRNQG